MADNNWGLCSTPVIKKSNAFASTLEQPINIYADFLNTNQSEQTIFTGNVVFKQLPNTSITTDYLLFDQNNDLLLSNAPSLIVSETSQIQADSFQFNNIKQIGDFKNASVQILDSHQFITANTLLQLNEHEQVFEGFSYSTCEPDDNAWKLSSSKLSLNYQTGLGVAKHAKIYLFDIPIFYFPYFQFPIDDKRHSGLLVPSFSLSSSKGHTLSIPFYWNIHPQLDMTIEFNQNSQRGLQINTETRYLTEKTIGSLITSSLNDKKTNTQREYYKLSQKTQLANNLNLELLYQEVSDADFFDDFSLIRFKKEPKFLERHLTIKHKVKNWDSTFFLQNHQILDDDNPITSNPYEQWPSLSTIGHYKIFNDSINLNIEQSYIHFDKEDSVTGERYSLNPSLSRKWTTSYSFIEPHISYSYSNYKLTHEDDSQTSLTRSLKTISIDSGLFFERIASEKNGWLQTFEPRLFYLNTPFKDQSEIPDFDTAVLSATYANLFKRNRFSGGDRIGDTKQLTLGLTSRLLSINSGLELFRLSLGQTFFSDDRLVQLSGTEVSEEKTSDLFLEIASQPHENWTITANLTQQVDTKFITQKLFKVTYNNNNAILNLSYRFNGTEDETKLEQTDISAVYHLNSQWTLFAKKHYSLKENENVEQLVGTSYDTCCWAFSMLIQEQTDKDFEETDRSLYFQFELKGFSSLGRDNQHLLSKSIPGYH